jgi:Tol biopolymer transport system component
MISLKSAIFLFALLILVPACSPVGPSADGSGRLVFFSLVDTRNFQLFTARTDGSDLERLVNDRADYTGPDWSPDGREIVFTSTRGGSANFDLYVMNADGTNIRHLYGSPFAEFAPTWSPDGSRIAFQFSTTVQSGRDIYSVKTDGTDLQRVTSSLAQEELPDWSPDGSKLVFEAGEKTRNIYTIDADGSNRVQLTDYNNTVLGAPVWSPDGSRIAFNSILHHNAQSESEFGQYEIYVMNADGSGVTRLTNLATPDRALRYPSWSPDGQRIVFESDEVLAGVLAFGRRIYTMKSDGSDLKEINMGQFARVPRFSPVP